MCLTCVHQVQQSISGMHFLYSTSSLLHNWYGCHLRFTINYFVQKYSAHRQYLVCEIREDNSMTIRLKSDAPSTIITLVRRLPFTLEEPVEHELRKLLAADIIEPITTSSYISPTCNYYYKGQLHPPLRRLSPYQFLHNSGSIPDSVSR